ncbi:alginate export family protein, partial [Lacticaseibacillus rhamnosus]
MAVQLKLICVWEAGALAECAFPHLPLPPWLGSHLGPASGDHQSAYNVLGSFMPLFPNVYYFTLAGFTGYVKLFH